MYGTVEGECVGDNWRVGDRASYQWCTKACQLSLLCFFKLNLWQLSLEVLKDSYNIKSTLGMAGKTGYHLGGIPQLDCWNLFQSAAVFQEASAHSWSLPSSQLTLHQEKPPLRKPENSGKFLKILIILIMLRNHLWISTKNFTASSATAKAGLGEIFTKSHLWLCLAWFNFLFCRPSSSNVSLLDNVDVHACWTLNMSMPSPQRLCLHPVRLLIPSRRFPSLVVPSCWHLIILRRLVIPSCLAIPGRLANPGPIPRRLAIPVAHRLAIHIPCCPVIPRRHCLAIHIPRCPVIPCRHRLVRLFPP